MISSKLRHAWRWNRQWECSLIGDLWTLIEEDGHIWIGKRGEDRRRRWKKSQVEGRQREWKWYPVSKKHNKWIWTLMRKRTGSDRYDSTNYVGKTTCRWTVMELSVCILRQTFWALYFLGAQWWPSFICFDVHRRAKKLLWGPGLLIQG